MAAQRRMTGSVAGLIAATLLVGNAAGQQPGAPPMPGSVPGSPSAAPDAPPTIPAPAPATQVVTPPSAGGTSGPIPVQQVFAPPSPQRFSFKIDPKTPVKELLPTPPKATPFGGLVLTDDLTKVPEADFQARPGNVPVGKLMEETAHQLAKMNHLNAKKTDAFMTALLENRADLAGLPFIMGNDCRTTGEDVKQFTIAVNTVRQALGGNRVNVNIIFNGPEPGGASGGAPFPGGGQGLSGPGPGLGAPQPSGPPAATRPFWVEFPALCDQQDAAQPRADKALRDRVTVARIAALMQMLAAESAEMRLGLVKYLTAMPHVDATRALAKLAIFSAEDEVRTAAIESLKVRREKDYTDILLKGLRYPWPAVAKHSAEAIAKMGRTDLIPDLVGILATNDPRMPATKVEAGKSVAVVHEMVKINHHRNCMMCHSPAHDANPNAITAQVPIPGQPLPSPSQGYQSVSPSPDLMIRVDVTYLRQDFSASLAVADAAPWPEMQRFDFFVRERKLTSDEAAEYREKLTTKEAGVLSPYHKAAVKALRDLTSKDTAPTAEAWKKLLGTKSRVE